MISATRKSVLLLSSVAFLAGVTACESSGGQRFSSITQPGASGADGGNTVGAQGPAGPTGSAGPQGRAGVQGAAGPQGSQGQSGTTLGRAGILATGGLVGPQGIAGTGLLASTGDLNSTTAASGVLVQGGSQTAAAAEQLGPTAGQIDGATPGGFSLSAASVQTVAATGQALGSAGSGQGYLVDGLTAAPGAVISLTGGEAQMLGSADQTPLVGASLFSSGQAAGGALTVGVNSAGEPLTVQTPALGDVDLLGGTAGLDGITADVTGIVSNLGAGDLGLDGLGLDGLDDVTGDLGVDGITNGLLGGLGG